MLPVRRIRSHPTVVMELDDQVVAALGRGEDRVLDVVHAGRLVRGRKQHSRPLWIEAPAAQETGTVRVSALEVPIQLGQANQVHLALSLKTGLPDALHAIAAFDKDLVASALLMGKVAIQDVLDPGAVVQETEERPAIRLGARDRVARDHNIEATLLPGEAIALADPLIHDRRTVAEVDEEPSDTLLVQRKEDVVAVIALKQLDDRIERSLVIDESDLEEQPEPLHPLSSLPSRA